jgi:hypothetical protein
MKIKLGFSFLSIIEFFEIIIEIVLIGGFKSSATTDKSDSNQNSSNIKNDTLNNDKRLFHLTQNNTNINNYHQIKRDKGCFHFFRNDKKIAVR